MDDIAYMNMAFDLALKGQKTVSPNPMVGAIIVKDDIVIGRGYHKRSGDHHAEINALHLNKKTPPCVPAVIKSGIKRVVIANVDPNPEVSGLGKKQLKEAGLEVVSGVLEDRGLEVNKVFFKNIITGLPYIHVKAALTLDGRMCAESGDSKWITSSACRKEVHAMRDFYKGVMVGSSTANADDPELTCRDGDKVISVPKRIIAGRRESLRDSLKVLNDEHKDSTIIVRKESNFESLKHLKDLGVDSILVEGGPTLLTSLFIDGFVDEYSFYIAPKMIGNGPSVFNHDKFQSMSESILMKGSWRTLGENEVVFEGRF